MGGGGDAGGLEEAVVLEVVGWVGVVEGGLACLCWLGVIVVVLGVTVVVLCCVVLGLWMFGGNGDSVGYYRAHE